MTPRSIDIHDAVHRRAALQGEEGAAWVDGLASLAHALARDWGLSLGRTVGGGTASIVLEAATAEGEAAILKIPIPWLDPQRGELRAMLAAGGVGYARIIRHDEKSGAMLLERLGPALATLELPIADQIAAICATLLQAWRRLAGAGGFTTGGEKARELAAFIETTAAEQPCAGRTVATALAYAEGRRAAFDPQAAVLGHGDAHAGNLLAAGEGYKFVDPDGLFIERAYDLGIAMRGWSAELMAGDPLALGQARCALLARLTGVAAEPIWQWGFIERVSTGLLLAQLGWEASAAECLAVADAWAMGD